MAPIPTASLKAMKTQAQDHGVQVPENVARRSFLGTACAGIAATGLGAALAACGEAPADSKPAKAAGEPHAAATAAEGDTKARYDVPPGQLDDYYIISSGGHSGEVRIFGL